MLTGIVLMNNVTLSDLDKYINGDIKEEHKRLWSLLIQGKSIIEKDNSCIEDLLEGFSHLGRLVKEVPELIEDICIGYCIIPLWKREVTCCQ